MQVVFRDINLEVCRALSQTFAKLDNVAIECGDILHSPIDCVISPANSFGQMDGGIDRIYVERMGQQLQDRIYAAISNLPFQEILIGDAIMIETQSSLAPYMIIAPTMRTPRPTTQENIMLAARIAFHAAFKNNVRILASPGLGTLIGRVEPYAAAAAMKMGYDLAVRSMTSAAVKGFDALHLPITHTGHIHGE